MRTTRRQRAAEVAKRALADRAAAATCAELGPRPLSATDMIVGSIFLGLIAAVGAHVLGTPGALWCVRGDAYP
jgi:hypothetical protein